MITKTYSNELIGANLLECITVLQSKYDNIEAAEGTNYNLFKTLGIERREIIHSRMIANLIDKYGTHGYHSAFLVFFLDILKERFRACSVLISTIENLEISSCRVFDEYYLGAISGKKGGVIDILIKDRLGNALIIENKIHANDQLNQLIRYRNSISNAPIIYLTLNGDEPSKESCGNLTNNVDFVCLSYRADILKWLDKCKNIISGKDNFRTSIKQYIYLIKDMTNQSTNENMENELISHIVQERKNIRAAFEIAESINKVKVRILRALLECTIDKLGSNWSITPWSYSDETKRNMVTL